MRKITIFIISLLFAAPCLSGRALPINYNDLTNNSTHILIAKVINTVTPPSDRDKCGKGMQNKFYTATLQVLSEIKGKDETGKFDLRVCTGPYAFNTALEEGGTYVLFLKKSGNGYIRAFNNRSVAKFR